MVGAGRGLDRDEGRGAAHAIPRPDRQPRGARLAVGRQPAMDRTRAHDALRRPRLVGARDARRPDPGGTAPWLRAARRQGAGAADARRRPGAARAAIGEAGHGRRALPVDGAGGRGAAARPPGLVSLSRRREAPARGRLGSRCRRRVHAAPRRRGHARGAAGPVAGRRARWLHRHLRGPGHRARRDGPRTAAGRAPGGGRRGTPVARRSRRADPRGGRGARRVARAVPMGGGALRARCPADVPRRRAGARQDRRGAGDARSRRGVPGDRRVPGVDEARLAARGDQMAAPPNASR